MERRVSSAKSDGEDVEGERDADNEEKTEIKTDS